MLAMEIASLCYCILSRRKNYIFAEGITIVTSLPVQFGCHKCTACVCKWSLYRMKHRRKT